MIEKFGTLFKTTRSRRRSREWGKVWGGGIALSIRLGGLRERRKLPQRGQAENGFDAF